MQFENRRHWDQSLTKPLELPERFAKASPFEIPNDVLKQLVRDYLSDFWSHANAGRAPGFFGGARRWKTYAAACVARWVQFNRIDVHWIECGPWFTRLDMLYFDPASVRLIDEVSTAPFVVLDDFTQVTPQTRQAQLLETVVQCRFSAGLPTCYTGNLALRTAEDFRALNERYGACVARRIIDSTQGLRLTV